MRVQLIYYFQCMKTKNKDKHIIISRSHFDAAKIQTIRKIRIIFVLQLHSRSVSHRAETTSPTPPRLPLPRRRKEKVEGERAGRRRRSADEYLGSEERVARARTGEERVERRRKEGVKKGEGQKE